MALAGLSVVLAVVALIVKRPGREPEELTSLLRQILDTADTIQAEDVLLETAGCSAKRHTTTCSIHLGIYGGIGFGRRHCFARRRNALITGEKMTQTKTQT